LVLSISVAKIKQIKILCLKKFDKDSLTHLFVVFSLHLATADGLFFTVAYQTRYYWTELKLQLVGTNIVKQMITYFFLVFLTFFPLLVH